MKCPVVRVLGLVAGLSGGAWAQDAGVLRQQIEGNRRIELPQRVLPDGAVRAVQPLAQSRQGPTLHIKRFRFLGNTVLSPQDFEPLLAEYAGKALDIEQLRDVLGPQVAELYRRKGWVVNVSLQEPLLPQTEEVVYNIIEARLGQVLIHFEN